MPFADYQPGEIAARGEKIYQEQIKSLVYPAEKGKFLFIDVESGDYELDEIAVAAFQRLRQRQPAAVCFEMKVGYVAAVHSGGSHTETND